MCCRSLSKLPLAILLLLFTFTGRAIAQDADITGTWDMVYDFNGTPIPQTSTFTQEGGVIGGTGGANGVTWSISGTIAGNEAVFTFTYNETVYNATSVATISGDSMSGTWSDSFGRTNQTFTATRRASNPLTRTSIPGAPVVSVTPSGPVTIALELFDAVIKKKGAAITAEAAKKKRKPKPKVRYNLSLVRPTGSIRRITTKKTLVTLNNLPPGTYSVSYTASAVVKGRKRPLYTTASSPSTSFDVQ